ncbi:sulfatase-like hydrolase/transferase [Neptunomonas sp.]|uniref:sulfatase-like hydrolase/transferase n=1 Tax=Neptunomonas sp. TaxID=1971898 RepID=UPI003562E8F9
MPSKPNILFIMADQLRADYLGCNGHPTIKTPTIDELATKGINFTRAYTQAPVCGPSRMSFYTGRYASSHGATYNNVPLKLSEKTIGDYLRPQGYRVGLVGKTHMKKDAEGMARLGIDPESSRGVLVSQCGFEPFERDDGLHPDQSVSPDLAYNCYLREQGYLGDNPWHEYANSGQDENGDVQSGWYMRNSHLSARVKEEHSETAYTTNRAIDFIRETKDEPWCLHLSYIKPHWPYIAPAPYHNMYSADDVLACNATTAEKDNLHPVIEAFMTHHESVNFSRQEVRENVIPVYMGLITQLDTHLKRLFDYLKEIGEYDNTVVVFTADHGDYLGDHWLGEKELFHEASARIPMIIHDPRSTAESTRGVNDDRLIEAIDLLPTFLDISGAEPCSHILEGRSLIPVINGQSDKTKWRRYAISEADYAWREARNELALAPDQTRAVMITDERWKYIHYEHFRPQLFDLKNDPQEQIDLAEKVSHRDVCVEMEAALYDWYRHRKIRTTVSNETVAQQTGKAHSRGYLFGLW